LGTTPNQISERGKINTPNTKILEMYFDGIYIAKFELGIDRTSLIYMNIRLKTLTVVLLLSLMRFCINLAS
jgi:membrane carboxypeptidase/penicillin-binding protein